MSKHKNKFSDQNQMQADPQGSSNTNKIIVSIVLAASMIVIALLITRTPSNSGSANNNSDKAQNYNVTEVNGTQIITLKAKGGYTPQVTKARAGIPTILRMETRGTFDCSSSIRIPVLGISKILPQSGTTDINLGTPSPGPLQGSCSMGMYPFRIEFE